jgi:hypothetical protein
VVLGLPFRILSFERLHGAKHERIQTTCKSRSVT